MSMQLGTYDELAGEYYDPLKHPTCSNFRELSEQFFRLKLPAFLTQRARILEVGAGSSVVAPIARDAGITLDHLVLLDKSQKMLSHSKRWVEQGAMAKIADACDTKLRSCHFDVIAGSLIDPYNCLAFWREVCRLLAPGGHVLATVPASEWSEQFRDQEMKDKAEFELGNGDRLLVSSFVHKIDDQVRMIESANLSLDAVASYSVGELSGPVSPKLLGASSGRVLNGFIAHPV